MTAVLISCREFSTHLGLDSRRKVLEIMGVRQQEKGNNDFIIELGFLVRLGIVCLPPAEVTNRMKSVFSVWGIIASSAGLTT